MAGLESEVFATYEELSAFAAKLDLVSSNAEDSADVENPYKKMTTSIFHSRAIMKRLR